MESTSSTRRRFALRFGLRSILVIMVAVAALLAWKFNELRQQRRVVAAIEEAGGYWLYDYQSKALKLAVSQQKPTSLEIIGPAPGPKWLKAIFGEDFFARVDLVHLAPDPLSDEMLDRLISLPALRDVNFSEVTDAHLARLAAARTLEQMTVGGDFTDVGVESISQLPRLKGLWIRSTHLTDAALKSLEKCKTLEDVLVEGKAFSQQQQDRLREALPDCEIRIETNWDSQEGPVPEPMVP